MTTKRWLDESSGSSERERAVLASGLDADPPAGAEAAVWASLAATLAVAPAASAVASASSATSATSATSAASAAKLASAATFVTLGKGFVLGVGVSLAAAGVGRLQHGPAPAPTPSLAAAPPAFQAKVAPSSGVTLPLEPAAPEPPGAVSVPSAAAQHPASSPAPSTPRARAGASRTSGEGATGVPPTAAFSPSQERLAAPPSKLEEEAAMLRSARAALRAGRLAEAFAELEAARDRFSLPELAQEREALLIELLHRSGQRASAVDKARRFLSRYPESPHAAKVRSIAEAGP